MKTTPKNDTLPRRAALLAPASPFAEPHLLEQSINALNSLGFEPVVYESARATSGYLAASDEVRARDLTDAFLDDGIDAIFCTRGGYGCMRLLPLLDYGSIAAHPKPLIGLSDITALHLALYHRSGLRTLHAPMPFRYPALPETAMRRLKAVLNGRDGACYTREDGIFPIHGGRVTAPMIGGNLTLVASLLASDYCPDFSGHVLFLEEVGEEEYRIDRLLTTLSLAGVFDAVCGVVFGGFTDCGSEEKIRRILAERIPEHLPTLGGFSAGHLKNNHAFREGGTVTLNATDSTLLFHPQ